MEPTNRPKDKMDTHRRAKIGHRKSRNGCRVCKSRRVKCDETLPVCSNCTRLKLDCSWPENNTRKLIHQYAIPSPPGRLPSPLSQSGLATRKSLDGNNTCHDSNVPGAGELLFPFFDSSEDIILPESRARRMLEHRLMQHWIFNMTKPFPLDPGQVWVDVFTKKVPSLALKYDNLLFIVMANAANHLHLVEPGNDELITARQSYLVSAIREQRNMVANLSVSNADAVCLTSLLLLIHSWARLQDRPLEPYSPPMEWIQMGRGAGTLIWMSTQEILKHGTEEEKAESSLVMMSNAYPSFAVDHEKSYFAPELRAMFNGVLTQKLPGSGDTWDDETRDTYEKTLSYVGSIQTAIDHGEPVYAICRRVQAFPLLVPSRFIEFLEEKRPRALVIVAHFFATVSQLPPVWWIGEGVGGRELTVHREIRAISKVLPREWAVQLVWPLDVTGLR